MTTQSVLDHHLQNLKGMKRPRSPTRKISPSHKDKRVHLNHLGQMLPRNHAEWNSALCLPYSQLVNQVNDHLFCLWITLEFISEGALAQPDELSYSIC